MPASTPASATSGEEALAAGALAAFVTMVELVDEALGATCSAGLFPQASAKGRIESSERRGTARIASPIARRDPLADCASSARVLREALRARGRDREARHGEDGNEERARGPA